MDASYSQPSRNSERRTRIPSSQLRSQRAALLCDAVEGEPDHVNVKEKSLVSDCRLGMKFT